MKPSVTVDERGVILHVTDSDGKGVAVPLSGETLTEIAAKWNQAKATLITPEGKRKFVRGLVELVLELTK